ncbi:gamma-aminobutyric acid receptor subunit alpha-2 isoform X4 [Lepeophtheirus salmonis]|nr:gamma-aminobutyric acid receptor subunit alpha-2-like isoform X1 [Lepeophtheirus salmonis]
MIQMKNTILDNMRCGFVTLFWACFRCYIYSALFLILSELSGNAISAPNVTPTFRCPESKEDDTWDEFIWCIPRNYHKEKPPFVGNGRSRFGTHNKLKLIFNFDVREISEVDDKSQTLSIPMYFSVAWKEPRLWINETDPAWNESITGPTNQVNENPLLMDEFWTPDLEIYGLEDFGAKRVLKSMSGLRVGKNKVIEYNSMVNVKISCRMLFDNYPFDKHKCYLQVGSYYYTEETVTCDSTFTDPLGNEPSRQRNLQYFIKFQDLPPEEKKMELLSGNYSACGFQITFERKRLQLIYQIYLPCILFVAVSWVSFLVRPECVPGRMGMLITLFLVLVNIFNTVRSSAPVPASSRLNAIDSYLVVCICMVFLALFEYAFLLFIIKSRDQKLARKKRKSVVSNLSRSTAVYVPPSEELEEFYKKSPNSFFDIRLPFSSNHYENKRENNERTVTVTNDNSGGNKADTTNAQENHSEDEEHPPPPRKIKYILKEDYYRVGPVSLIMIDYIAMVTLPVTFSIYNAFYWTADFVE